MGRKLLDKDGPTLGLRCSQDLYHKLIFDAERLSKDWNGYDAFNFLVTAWHLFNDWLKSDPKKALSRSKRNKRILCSEMVLVLDVVKDLVNGSKHFELDKKNADNRKVEQTHNGLEADYYSFFFHEDTLGVSVVGNWYFSIRVLHNIIINYYHWVFDDNKPCREFPPEILEAIEYCNITKRHSGSAPEIWAANS